WYDWSMRTRARKDRLTITLDHAIVEAGNEAVAAGRADSLSGWINSALAARVAQDHRRAALAEAVAAYEAEFGVITEEEMLEQARADRKAAIHVPGRSRSKRRRRRAA